MASSVRTCGPSAPADLRRGAPSVYRWLLLAFLLAGVAQIFLAGLGVFTLAHGGAGVGSAYSAHGALGLHALDGLLILGIAGFLCASSRRWRS